MPAATSTHSIDERRSWSRTRCHRWLTDHHEGRLGYRSDRGPRAVVVTYAVVDGRIFFHLPEFNDIVHYAPGQEVTLTVDGRGEDGAIAEVSVTGTATVSDNGTGGRFPDVGLEQWPTGVETRMISLPLSAYSSGETA